MPHHYDIHKYPRWYQGMWSFSSNNIEPVNNIPILPLSDDFPGKKAKIKNLT